MIVFLSASFLRRLELGWKPELKAILMGHRNLFFFTPDALQEVSEISPEVLDTFLSKNLAKEGWELLGTLSPQEPLAVPGLAHLMTMSDADPSRWKGSIYLLENGGLTQKTLEIRCSGRSQPL